MRGLAWTRLLSLPGAGAIIDIDNVIDIVILSCCEDYAGLFDQRPKRETKSLDCEGDNLVIRYPTTGVLYKAAPSLLSLRRWTATLAICADTVRLHKMRILLRSACADLRELINLKVRPGFSTTSRR